LALSAQDAKALLGDLPRIEAARDALVAARIPETLVPRALSLSDILVPESKRSPVSFVGWGGARWSHPFGWVAPLVEEMAARGAEAELDAAVEAYLDGFSEHGSTSELSALFGPAEILATVQQHEELMDLLLAGDLADQEAGAPEAFRLLDEIFGSGASRPRRRH
jgi:hypothetical protein